MAFVLLVLLMLATCFPVSVCLAEGEIVSPSEDPEWLRFLEELGIDHWVSQEELNEVYKEYIFFKGMGATWKQLLDIKTGIEVFRQTRGSFVFIFENESKPVDLSKLTVYESLDIYGLALVEETICPRYYADLYDLAVHGTLEFTPLRKSWDPEGPALSCARVETEDHRFGGTVTFYYDEDGVPRYDSLTRSSASKLPISKSARFSGSYWYEDQKSAVTEALKQYGETTIPGEKVKLTVLGHYTPSWNLGGITAFYAEGENGNYFITIPHEDDTDARVIPVDETLRQQAIRQYRDYLEQQEKIREWTEEHPGEVWIGGGPGETGEDSEFLDDPDYPGYPVIPMASDPGDGNSPDSGDMDQTASAPEDPAESGDTEPGEADATPAAGLPAVLAVTVAVCAAVAVILTGVLRLFGR